MAASNIGNPAGFVSPFDQAAPCIITCTARNAIISGGVFVFSSGGADLVSSGLNSFTTSDLLVAADASGGQFTGIATQTSAVSGLIPVLTRGFVVVAVNGTTTGGVPQVVDANNSVHDVGSETMTAYSQYKAIGRALVTATSGGYTLLEVK